MRAHYFLPPAGADAPQQSRSFIHPKPFPRFRLAEGERLADKRVLMFALSMSFGAAACAGTILALFALTGAGL
jgi:hypothetical protein